MIFAEFIIVIKTYRCEETLQLAFFGRTRVILIKVSLFLDL